MARQGVLFVPYKDTLDLLSPAEALRIAEDVYRMQAAGSIVTSSPPAFKLDIAEPYHNHWHVKCALLKDIPATGVRLYNYYNDGARNTVGGLECARYIVLTDPRSQAHFALDSTDLRPAGFFGLLRLYELEAPVVEDLADRRLGIRGNLHQIHLFRRAEPAAP